MKQLLRFIMPLACLASFTEHAVAQYVSTGPYGGAVFSLYSNNGVVLAAGTGGVYTGGNNGSSWQEATSTPNVFGCDLIYSVAASGGLMFAGSRQSGIFRSVDGGNSWTPTTSGLNINPGAPYTDLEIIGPNVLAIRADSGFLFLSNNQGAGWTRINFAIAGSFAQYLSFHNMDVFVSTPQGLFKSMDNGVNYNNINPQPADFGKPYWVNDTLYVATATGVKMSVDQGANFTTVALSGRAVRSVAVSGNNMYAVVRNPAPIQDSVLYSTNNGANFSAVPFNDSNFRFTVVNDLLATSNGVVVGSDYGVYGTANNGNSWGRLDSGYNATSIRALTVSGAYVLAGTSPMGIYRVKPDSGALDWRHSGDVAHNVEGNIQCITSKAAYVHAGGTKGYYRSVDGGATWGAGASGVPNGNITSLFAQPGTSDVWMVRNGNLHYSSDDGTSFGQVVNSNIPGGISKLVFKADTNIFVSTVGSLYKAGTTMSFNVVSGLTGVVTGLVYLGNTYYAATSNTGLYSSTNGASWSPVSISGTLPSKVNAFISDGTDLIAGTDDGFYSNNGGTWAQAGLSGHSVQSIALRNGKLFAGTCSGVYSIPYKIVIPPNSVSASPRAADKLEIRPNPSSGEATVVFSASNGGEVKMVLSDITGKTLLSQSVNIKGGENRIPLSAARLHLTTGIYFVQLSGNGLAMTGRLAIQ